MIKLIETHEAGEVIKGIVLMEGITVFSCSKCNHTFNVPNSKSKKTEVKCTYCGEAD